MGWRFVWFLIIEKDHTEGEDGDARFRNRGKLAQVAVVGLAVVGIVGIVLWRTYRG